MAFNNFETILRQVLETTSGLSADKIRRANQNAPFGNCTFLTYQITISGIKGAYDEEKYNTDGTITNYVVRLVTVDINIYGPGGLDYAYDIYDKIKKETTYQVLRENKIGLINQNVVRDLTFIEIDQYVERGNLQFEFETELDNIIDNVGYFDTAEISTDETQAGPTDLIGRPIVSVTTQANTQPSQNGIRPGLDITINTEQYDQPSEGGGGGGGSGTIQTKIYNENSPEVNIVDDSPNPGDQTWEITHNCNKAVNVWLTKNDSGNKRMFMTDWYYPSIDFLNKVFIEFGQDNTGLGVEVYMQ